MVRIGYARKSYLRNSMERFDRRQGLSDPFIVPGAIVRHPDQPDWGLGQVQSAIGTRVTVNFEHAGKVVINAAVISLSVVDPETDLI